MDKDDKKYYRELLDAFTTESSLNRFELEKECEKQVSLCGTYYEAQADLRDEKTVMDRRIAFEIGKKEMQIRANPDDYDFKLTESSITAILAADDDLEKLRNELTIIKSYLYKFDACVVAIEHRRSELNNLTQLHISGYYSAPDGKKKSVKHDSTSLEIKKGMNKNKDKENENG